jgi:microcystin-dependent protein
MAIIKKLSSLTAIKRKTPTDRQPTGFVNNDSITSSMIRDLAVQTRHLGFILSGGTGVTYSLPARIFGVTTSATAYQFVRFTGTTFTAAQANNASNATVLGVLVPNFNGQAVDVVTQGVVNGFSGLVTNSIYYLSPSIAGTITATVPTSGVLVAVGRALSSTSMLINIDPNIARVNKLETHVLPAGSMVDYAGTSAPSGWLMCDGSEISRTTYADLFAAIGVSFGPGNNTSTFNLPDFRGRFARYNDNMGTTAGAANRDAGRVHGSSQTDALQGHKHGITDPGHTHTIGSGATTTNAGGSFTTSNYDALGSTRGTNTATTSITVDSPTTDGTNGVPRIAAETRPVNLACNKIIKLYNY